MTVITHRHARSGRFRELGLLIISLAIGLGAWVIATVALEGMPENWVSRFAPLAALCAGVTIVTHVLIRWRAPYSDPVLLPIVIALNGLGLAMITRLDAVSSQPFSSRQQFIFTGAGMIIAIALIWLIRDHRSLRKFTYISMVVAVILLLLPMVPGLGITLNGARIWIKIPVLGYSFQPAELAKIFLAIFFAGYLTDQRDNLTLTGPKILGIQFPRARHLVPILVIWAVAVAILVAQKDLGTSLLLFGLFVSMLYVATDRFSWVLIGMVLLLAAAVLVAFAFPHVTERFDAWLDPFNNQIYERTYGGSYQLVTGLFGMAFGGLFGTGLGSGYPQMTPAAYSDYIFTAFGEELGLTGAFAILTLYMIFILRGMRAGTLARDGFGALLASGLAFTLALQIFVVVGGVTRLIPVTGLTLPFIAYGGSSLVCNWMVLALLIRISDSTRRPGPRRSAVVPAQSTVKGTSAPGKAAVRVTSSSSASSADSPENLPTQEVPRQ